MTANNVPRETRCERMDFDQKVSFTIPGNPVAKGRARAFIRGKTIGHYTPEKTAKYESLVRLAAAQAMGSRQHTDTAVVLAVEAVFAIPKSWSQKKQRAAAIGDVRPTGRPDIDNVVKAIKDGCNSVVWRDDSQVVRLMASKVYGAPCVRVVASWC